MTHPSDEPLVGIVTPAYNAEPYIAETIRSVLAQTLHPLELLIVDDGSSDRTVEISRRFADADSRVRVFERPNGGTAAARNTAIRHGRAQYFTLLDSDDVLMPSYVAEQLAILEAHPEIDIVSANMINLGGPLDGTPLKPTAGAGREISLLDLIAVEDSVCILSTFRRRVIEIIGGFDETLRTNEDYDFWLRAVSAGCRILFTPEPLGYYRRRPDSVSANEEAMLAGIVAVLTKTRSLLAGRAEELEALDRQLARFARRRSIAMAKSALVRCDFATAADHLWTLYEATGNCAHYGLAEVAMRAPHLLLWGYSARKAWRSLRRTRRADPPSVATQTF